MFCPQCGTSQSEELKFCNKCGANLHAVRQVVTTRETEEKFDWNKTWVTQMFLTQEELKKRRGITPEIKRFNEIKAGVITSCVGIALMIFLFVLMNGIVLSGQADPKATEILIRIWVVGIIPLMVGLGLIINGTLVSKKMLEAKKENPPEREISIPHSVETKTTNEIPYLGPADTNKFIPTNFSVVDESTELLKTPLKKATTEGKSRD